MGCGHELRAKQTLISSGVSDRRAKGGWSITSFPRLPNEVKPVLSANMQLTPDKQNLLAQAMLGNPGGHISRLVITECQMSVSAFWAKRLLLHNELPFIQGLISDNTGALIMYGQPLAKKGKGPIYDMIPISPFISLPLPSQTWINDTRTQERKGSSALSMLFKWLLTPFPPREGGSNVVVQ